MSHIDYPWHLIVVSVASHIHILVHTVLQALELISLKHVTLTVHLQQRQPKLPGRPLQPIHENLLPWNAGMVATLQCWLTASQPIEQAARAAPSAAVAPALAGGGGGEGGSNPGP